MTVIRVVGSASQTHAAEHVGVRVRILAEDPSVSRATELAATALDDVLERLRQLVAAGAAERVASQTVLVSHRDEWSGEAAPRRVHCAAATFEVTFVELAALSTWLGQAGASDYVEIDGLDWRLTDPTRARLETETRLEALQDAKRRAADYAAAADLAAPQVREIREPLAGDAGGVVAERFANRAVAMSADAPQFALAANSITVSASVIVDFEA